MLLVLEADDDYTGCIYLGVFDDTSDEPLAIYGGPGEADFTWKLNTDGSLEFDEAVLARSLSRAKTRGDGNYGQNMTNVSSAKSGFTNGSVTVTNGGNSVTLKKASEERADEIVQKLSTNIKSNVSLKSGGKAPANFSEDDIR